MTVTTARSIPKPESGTAWSASWTPKYILITAGPSIVCNLPYLFLVCRERNWLSRTWQSRRNVLVPSTLLHPLWTWAFRFWCGSRPSNHHPLFPSWHRSPSRCGSAWASPIWPCRYCCSYWDESHRRNGWIRIRAKRSRPSWRINSVWPTRFGSPSVLFSSRDRRRSQSKWIFKLSIKMFYRISFVQGAFNACRFGHLVVLYAHHGVLVHGQSGCFLNGRGGYIAIEQCRAAQGLLHQWGRLSGNVWR